MSDSVTVYNVFQFFGDSDSVLLLLNSFRGLKAYEQENVPAIDFNKIIPPPSDDGWHSDANEAARAEWNLGHWGCRANGYSWNSVENYQSCQGVIRAVFTFFTDGSAPLKIIEALIAKSAEAGIRFHGKTACSDLGIDVATFDADGIHHLEDESDEAEDLADAIRAEVCAEELADPFDY